MSPEIAKPIKYDENYEKCGLGLVASLVLNFERLTEEQQLILKPLLQRPTTDVSFVTPNGFFRVHYDTIGFNAPGYDLNLLADALDSTYRFEIDFLGYNIPPGDSAVNPDQPPGDYGGDNRYDLYIGNLGSGTYGYTRFDELEVEPGSGRFTSYMHIHNSFAGFYSTGINGARVTVAHEFHHAIQGGNYIFRIDDSYFYEITSTAMEEFVFDDVNDYYAYITSYFNNPETALPSTSGYNTATWNIFLQQHFDDYDIIKRQWELMPSTRAMNAISISLF
ncbi:MAG: MXAN_6640 family putative metalloprotease, partial [Candidatus Kariarchaeaceae archaeon]